MGDYMTENYTCFMWHTDFMKNGIVYFTHISMTVNKYKL